ncbi:hypothetical protein TNCV_4267301 [Trichonephila clavipes]|nr:hypothetical protein TNCV_4267301 [Trichonephila clavipes]
MAFSITNGEIFVKVSGVFRIKKRNESEYSKWCSTEGEFLLGSINVFLCSFQYASTHHGAQQGEAARRSSDMRQARHLPQRWYWSIVVQVRDVIRQFTQGTPNCNTNPKATVFGIPKEPVLESAELITSRLTGAGSLLRPVYGEAWAKGHATGTPDSTFPRYGSPHTANMRVRLKKPVLTLRNAKSKIHLLQIPQRNKPKLK